MYVRLIRENTIILNMNFLNFYFFKDFIYLILDRGERREKERERNINV